MILRTGALRTPAPWLREWHVADLEAIDARLVRALEDLEHPEPSVAPLRPVVDHRERSGSRAGDLAALLLLASIILGLLGVAGILA